MRISSSKIQRHAALIPLAMVPGGAMVPAPAMVTLAMVLAGVLLMSAAPTTAQSGVVDSEARHIYMELMSPFCPGLSLAACQSSKAGELREEIRERLAAGETREEIVASIVERYGESVLATPPNRGFGRFAWLAPIGVGLFGLFLVVILLRHFARSRAHKPVELPELDPAMRERIEREIDSTTRP